MGKSGIRKQQWRQAAMTEVEHMCGKVQAPVCILLMNILAIASFDDVFTDLLWCT